MMNMLIVLVTAHLLGDFYLQTQKQSEKKILRYRFVLLHCLVYAISSLVFVVFQPTKPVILMILCYIFFHLIIDSVKFFMMKSVWLSQNEPAKYVYCADQIVHFGSLFILAYWVGDLINRSWIDRWFSRDDLTIYTVFRLLLMFLLIFKPANVTFRKLFSNLKPEDDASKSEHNQRAGAIIGNMERLLIALLMLLGQYTAIGLVITGKSIARYKKIADEKSFAEYYLIGTFYSLIVVIISFLILH